MATDLRESAWDCVSSDKTATFSTSESSWISKIEKLAKEYPDSVKIECEPEDNFGMLLAHLPKSWMKIRPPKKVNLTDEQREERSERMKLARQKKKENNV